MKGVITNIKRFAVHDGDGIRTTVFFKGCPLKCVWCHNPESISFERQIAYFSHKCKECGICSQICDANIFNGTHIFERERCTVCGKCADICQNGAFEFYGKEMSSDEILGILLEDRIFYTDGGGITLSGGECLCQADFCAELLKKCKENGLNTAVDTCGFVPRSAFEKVMPFTDTFLYDIKAIDGEVHKRCTGRPNDLILENLKYLDDMSCKIEVRIPYVPDFNDLEIIKIRDFLKDFKNISRVKVLPYHNLMGSKYDALGLENALPVKLPEDYEILKAGKMFV